VSVNENVPLEPVVTLNVFLAVLPFSVLVTVIAVPDDGVPILHESAPVTVNRDASGADEGATTFIEDTARATVTVALAVAAVR
jgi:hypothetical protein